MRRAAILVILAVFLAGYAFSVMRMEHLRENGRDALFRLAPVDPRALLMGDYMTLDFAVNGVIWSALCDKYADGSRSRRESGVVMPSEAKAVVRLATPQGVVWNSEAPEAVFARLDDGTPLAEDEALLAFKVRGTRVISAAPAFYFQEGYEEAYSHALYGRLRMDGSGKTLLIALCDREGRDIRVERKSANGG